MTEVAAYTVIMGLFAIYAVVDGFDLGVGILQPFTSDHTERSILQAAIGPLWNGNEVWLITAGGALFAAFPAVYATVCSALYFPVILLLMGFIIRAIFLEVRNSLTSAWWRNWCDAMFSLGSVLIAFIFGVAIGNLMRGLPLNDAQEYTGTLFDLIQPYPVLVGIMSVALFAMHGALFSILKTENPLHDALAKRLPLLLGFFLATFVLTITSTFLFPPHIASHIVQRPLFWIVGVFSLFTIAAIPYASKKRRDGVAFAASCCTVFSLIALYAIATFPTLVRSLSNPEAFAKLAIAICEVPAKGRAHISTKPIVVTMGEERSELYPRRHEQSAVASFAKASTDLTVFNSASSTLSLRIFLMYIGIGIPFVLAYSFFVYWTFRGKTHPNTSTY